MSYNNINIISYHFILYQYYITKKYLKNCQVFVLYKMQLLIFIGFISLSIKQVSLKCWFVYDNNKHILYNTNLKKSFIIFFFIIYKHI